ncbi:MAG: site-2 protease family protein [Solirubrobacteraceae bacterium]
MENSELSLTPAAPASQHPNPFGEPVPLGDRPTHPAPEPQHGRLRRRIGSILAALAALAAKFWAAIKIALLALPKLKLLTTGGTALVSVLAYTLWFGLPFAVGLVILLFVHEMGHVIQLRREGVPASAPMFIPFFGAVVMMRSMPDDALAEARVGLAGPVLGTAGAAVCLGLAEAFNSDLLRALAYFGFLINLFNLIPVVPLDGGRAMAAMAPAMWFIGLGAIVFLALLTGNIFLLLIAAIGGYELYRRWKARKSGNPKQAAYYRVSPRNRLLVGLLYIGLIVVLALGMDVSHVLASGGHSFRTL